MVDRKLRTYDSLLNEFGKDYYGALMVGDTPYSNTPFFLGLLGKLYCFETRISGDMTAHGFTVSKCHVPYIFVEEQDVV